ncbi:hypothetical protein ACFWCB_23955 [Streptomyces sp. NPDC060048]|uniref:hypothetical protein n=1 Tax=unclassified Streptomyces TaxID=2593676 RepID=UPI00367A78FA
MPQASLGRPGTTVLPSPPVRGTAAVLLLRLRPDGPTVRAAGPVSGVGTFDEGA